jgi:O-antigen/teichoic acid export membrane protein
MKELKERTIRGGLAKVCSQAAIFALRLGSLMFLGRLLDPKDFGLVGMVSAVLGVFNLFKDFGLSTATVQRTTITEGQISTLFWINVLVGTVLGLLAAAAAPVIAAFYHEPRLIWITTAMAAGFLINSAGVQHTALLQREMRFTAMAVIEVASQLISTAVGIGMALAGFSYWSLVVMAISAPIVSTVSAWIARPWVPGAPRRNVGIRSMMRFGGTLTLNGLVVYVAYNLEKVLLGRYWGADAIGLYGRAFQLVTIPTENLNCAVGGVVFSALSRVQDDPSRFRNYFLTGYSLVLALTMPITILCALFAKDIMLVVLGPKWDNAADVFRLLAPTILVFAMINPFGWFLFSLGMVSRSLKVALVLAPIVMVGYIIGLSHGPKGVALGYSAAMVLWVVPHVLWCIHGTVISVRDIVTTVGRPLVSGIVAGILAYGMHVLYGHLLPPLPRLLAAVTIMSVTYAGMLLYIMKQKSVYIKLLRGTTRPSVEENTYAIG